MSIYEMKLLAITTGMVVSVFTGIAGYFAVYDLIRRDPKWQHGRGVGVSLQYGIAAWFLFWIPLLALLCPRLSAFGTSPRDWQAAVWLAVSVPFLVASVVLQASNKFVQQSLRRYCLLLNIGIGLSGVAMLIPGLAWLADITAPTWIGRALLGGAYFVAAIDEWLFLRANGWHFLPEKPR